VALTTACGGPGSSPPSGHAAGACAARQESPEVEGETHVRTCRPVSYRSMPPSSGIHYDSWAAYRTYTEPVPWGFLVHNLEHGGIVISYRCEGGCPDEVAQAQALIDELPVDGLCTSDVKRRIILVPQPELRTRWAASAWGNTLAADCFDRGAFQGFITQYYAKGRENTCYDGVDLSADGWCPSPSDAGSGTDGSGPATTEPPARQRR
jgi:hypothetical protein